MFVEWKWHIDYLLWATYNVSSFLTVSISLKKLVRTQLGGQITYKCNVTGNELWPQIINPAAFSDAKNSCHSIIFFWSKRIFPKVTQLEVLNQPFHIHCFVIGVLLSPSIPPAPYPWFTAGLPLLPGLQIPFCVQLKCITWICKATDYLNMLSELNVFSWLTCQEVIHFYGCE